MFDADTCLTVINVIGLIGKSDHLPKESQPIGKTLWKL